MLFCSFLQRFRPKMRESAQSFTGITAVMLFIPLFLQPGQKKKHKKTSLLLARAGPGLDPAPRQGWTSGPCLARAGPGFPPVFGPYKTGLCFAAFALRLAQVRIHADSWSTLFQIRPNFAFLLVTVDRLISFDNLLLIFCPLTLNYAPHRNSPSFPPKLRSNSIRWVWKASRSPVPSSLFCLPVSPTPIQLTDSCQSPRNDV